MGKFLNVERTRQAYFKAISPIYSEPARSDGIYKNKSRPFCLPLQYAEENLFPLIRETASQYFSDHRIKWHDGQNGKPSNHLCDSQVCCVNFLFPFADKPRKLAQILLPLYPEIEQMLPIESGLYVAFEWIGEQNYLGEKAPRSGRRTRGANFTSADAAIMFKRKDHKRQFVLIEWKYTESYGSNSLKIAPSGTDRTAIYRRLFENADCPVKRDVLPGFDSLFYEPFYQLMRQQFLALEMEKANEMGADIVSVLHIAPAHNTDFRRITSPALTSLGKTSLDVWKKLVLNTDRFASVSTERLFGGLTKENLPDMASWLDYIHARYTWVVEQDPI